MNAQCRTEPFRVGQSGGVHGVQTVFLALGPLEVRRQGRAVDLGPPKQREVLGVLLAESPHAVPVSRLVDELWPEAPPGDPVRNLQVYVSALRRVLGDEPPLLSTPGRAYRLDIAPEQLDVNRFHAAAAEAEGRLRAGDLAGAVRTGSQALALWRGAAWQDLRHLPGVQPAGVRLDERRLDVVALTVAARLELGEHRDLVPELEEMVARHPLREDLRAQLMRALHRCGRQTEALGVYADGRALKVAETGLEPGAELQALHAAVLADDPALAVEEAGLRARRHLPAPVTGLVGRDHEVDELVELLGPGGDRLVTVTGAGGVGKTRVALQAADRLVGRFPDGVWFVGLDHLADPALVPQALAEALGAEPASGDFVPALRDHLARRRLLLVLDNFEQVEEAAPLLADLLAAAPGARVLVTSRTRLHLYGERVWELEPLPVPDAVRLFLDRARSADRYAAQRLGPADLSRVRAVCEALDGLPLAVELAAARVAEVTVDEMAGRLGARLDLAAQGPRDRSPRQQTLRGAVGWSVDLLSGEAATAFRRLGTFVGGFESAAAAIVTGVDEASLAELHGASLLVGADHGRHRMLETVRAYAVEQLETSGDGHAVRDAHAAWAVDLAHEGAAGLRGPEAGEWLARLQRERGNLRAALAHLAAAGEPAGERLLTLAADLALFFYRTSPASEDVEWLPRALDAAPGADPALRARAWHGLAICRGEQGRVAEAIDASRASYHLLGETDDPVFRARVLNTLGGLTRDAGRTAEAVPVLEESVALRRRLADPALPLAIALGNRAMAALDVGDLAGARACLEESLALASGDDDPHGPLTETLLADVAIEAGSLDEARTLLRRAVPALQRHGMRFRLVECLDSFAALAARCGRLEDAATLAAAADAGLAEDAAVRVPADVSLRERRIGRALAGLAPEVRAAAERVGAELRLEDALAWATERLL